MLRGLEYALWGLLPARCSQGNICIPYLETPVAMVNNPHRMLVREHLHITLKATRYHSNNQKYNLGCWLKVLTPPLKPLWSSVWTNERGLMILLFMFFLLVLFYVSR